MQGQQHETYSGKSVGPTSSVAIASLPSCLTVLFPVNDWLAGCLGVQGKGNCPLELYELCDTTTQRHTPFAHQLDMLCFRMAGRVQDSPERKARLLQQCLRLLPKGDNPRTWALANHNLGQTYAEVRDGSARDPLTARKSRVL